MVDYNKPRSLEDVNQTWSNINNKINSIITPSPQALQTYSPEYQARYRQPVISNIQPSVKTSNNTSMRQLGGQIDMGPDFKYLQTPLEARPTTPLADYTQVPTTPRQAVHGLTQPRVATQPVQKLDAYGIPKDVYTVEMIRGLNRELEYYNPETGYSRVMQYERTPEGFDQLVYDSAEPGTEYGKALALQKQKGETELTKQRLANQAMISAAGIRSAGQTPDLAERKFKQQQQNTLFNRIKFYDENAMDDSIAHELSQYDPSDPNWAFIMNNIVSPKTKTSVYNKWLELVKAFE